MRQRCPGARLVVVVGAIGLALAAPAEAQRPPLARGPSLRPLFGVDVGSPIGELEQVVRDANVACHQPSTEAIVCRAGVRRPPLQMVTTYWIAGGRIARMFQKAEGRLSSYSHHVEALRLLRGEVELALETQGKLVSGPLPAWASALDDAGRLRALSEGRLAVEYTWSLPGVALTLSLKGDSGQPALVLLAEPATAAAPRPAAGCGPEQLAAALTSLFPPADPAVRAASAATLAGCGDPRAAGALASVLEHDPQVAVRVEAVRALVASGDRQQAATVMADRRAPDPLRAAALGALAAAGAAPADSELAQATRQPGPDLRAAVAALAQQRSAAAAAAPEAPAAPSPASPAPELPAPPTGAPRALPPGPPPVIAGPPPPARVLPPLRPVAPLPPPPPPKPWTERDGTPLAITASVAAGGLWGGSLALLAQQDGVGVVTLLGGAGAVIGGGTAWGITRFGLRPSAAQALWFTNSTAWGSLAGLTIWSGSGSDSPKLKYGLLVGGETLGIVAGAWSARRYHFTPGQTVFADSLVIGSGLGLAGVSMMLDPDSPWQVPPAAAIGVVPTLIGAAVAARHSKISEGDVPLLLTAPLLAGWTGSLLAAGGYQERWLGTAHTTGGALLGVGAGYLGAAAAASFVEVSRLRLTMTSLGMMAGNAIGFGSLMVARPDDDGRWSLGAGVGGLVLGTTVFALGPRLHPGPQAVPMTVMGGIYGAGTWALALAAASTGQGADARLPGGMLAGGVAAGAAGLVASQFFHPDAYDQVIVAGGTATGMAAGLGTAKLLTGDKGAPDFAGVIGGAAVGFVGGVALARGPQLRAPAFASAAIGGGYGLMVGSLLPTLDEAEWQEGRKTAGASWLGLSLGVAGGTLLARDTGASGGQVALVTGAGTLGAGMGAGLGWMFPSDDSQPARIGLLAGSTGMLAAGLLAEQHLQLTSHLGTHSMALGLFGGGLGLTSGLLAASVVQPDLNARLAGQQRAGAALLGSSAGVAAGVFASRWLHPTDVDYAMVAGATLLGHSAGLGVARLAFAPEEDLGLGLRIDPPDRREPMLRLGGALLGMGGGMLAARATDLRPLDLAAGGVGTVYGAVLGALAPNLHREDWHGDRQAVGGGHLGAAIGGVAAATAAHLTDASAVEIQVPAIATALGGVGGLAFGAMLPTSGHQSMRVGTFSGALAVGAASLALARPLRLHEGFAIPGTGGATLVGLTLGTGNGLLLAGLVDPTGSFELVPDRQASGGIVFGQALGATTGFLWTRFFQPSSADGAAAIGGSVFGASLGWGLSMLLSDPVADGAGDPQVAGPHGRLETAATLGGSLLGLSAAGLTQRYSPLTSADVGALVVGASFGSLFGRLAPTLDQKLLDSPIDRASKGGLLTGLGAGGLGAIALRRATGARGSTLGLAALGGVHGTLTGWGVGLLIDDEEGDSQAQRIGVTAGGAAGLAVGAGLWPHLDVERRDAAMIASMLALGGWNGAWAATLGRANKDDVSERRVWGGVAAGAGGASMLATALVPALSLEPDLMGDALWMDLYLSAAGFGVGALASPRFDALGLGVIGGGAAGLLLGGVFHRAIDVGPEDRPLHAVAALEGVWLGAWLPFALWQEDQVTARQVAGGISAGMMGGLALARLASPLVQADSQTAAGVGMGSAIGAALAGGSALMANDLNGRGAVGVMLGGTGAGMLLGGVIAPDIDLVEGLGYGTAGAVLGTSEALVFAWAGRSDGRADYAGAALVGAGLGSSIGLAAAAHPEWMQGRALPAAGFAGWGAWMGSFAGALIDRNSHEVTLGGLAGANVGFLAGWGLLKTEVVEPRDIGWLSAFGAAGTVVGGGVGALFSTREDSRPALAGLLVGPAVGLGVGAIVLPHMRGVWGGGAVTATATATTPSTSPSPATLTTTTTTTTTTTSTATTTATDALTLSVEGQETSADWDDRRERGRREGWGKKIHSAIRPSQVIPVIGALPRAPDGPPGPPPFLFGLAGLWR